MSIIILAVSDLIAGRGWGGGLLCQCTSQLRCSKQVLTHSFESQTLKKGEERLGGEILSVKSSKYDPEF
jgi:hypothetical protein